MTIGYRKKIISFVEHYLPSPCGPTWVWEHVRPCVARVLARVRQLDLGTSPLRKARGRANKQMLFQDEVKF